ncbi:toxin TumE [Leptolyngbya sp. PCC 6406]|uniref:toxin TumE n=1 Tax=Leptolyngbya sp. PCC 6406 TaxID=1173264 RepID=UPI0002ABD902|nr:DUF6516 family protein [Leptolyngbya sp. PCC 6406]
MLHEQLSRYLGQVEAAVSQYPTAYVERYTEEILTPERVNLRLRLRFDSGRLLEINEAVVVVENQLTFLDYRYHCQDENNQLLFRYDSTPHFPDLSTFPHHKHLPKVVIASEKPDITQVLQEVSQQLPGFQ